MKVSRKSGHPRRRGLPRRRAARGGRSMEPHLLVHARRRAVEARDVREPRDVPTREERARGPRGQCGRGLVRNSARRKKRPVAVQGVKTPRRSSSLFKNDPPRATSSSPRSRRPLSRLLRSAPPSPFGTLQARLRPEKTSGVIRTREPRSCALRACHGSAQGPMRDVPGARR